MDVWIQFVIALCAVIALMAGGIASLLKLGISVGKLQKQMTPNGGTTDSLGDRVVRLEISQGTQTETLRRIEASIAETAGRDEKSISRLVNIHLQTSDMLKKIKEFQKAISPKKQKRLSKGKK